MQKIIKISFYIFIFFSVSNNAQTNLPEPDELMDNSKFGYGVAINSSWAVVSANGQSEGGFINSGKAYIYNYTGGNWAFHSSLVPEEIYNFHLFGSSVALDGGTIVIGAPGDKDNGLFYGAIYVYEYFDGVWNQTAKLFPSDGIMMEQFGKSIDIANNRIVAGAPFGDGEINKSGAAYVFEKRGEVWIETAKLIPSNSKTNDMFGYDVAIRNDGTVVVGTPRSAGLNQGEGAIYVFRYNGSYSKPIKLFDEKGSLGDRFGFSVSIDKNRIAVGSYMSENNSIFPGAVSVFAENEGIWSLETKIFDDNDHNDYFGYDIVVKSNYLLIGTPSADIESAFNAGSASLYKFNGSIWEKDKRFQLQGINKNDYFASSVAMDTVNLLIGARLFGETDKGAAYIERINSPPGILPDKYSLSQNYPNPFNPFTTINYALPVASRVRLFVYDALGRRVEILVNEDKSAGYFETVWNAKYYSSGVYFLKIEAEPFDKTHSSFSSVKKMILLK